MFILLRVTVATLPVAKEADGRSRENVLITSLVGAEDREKGTKIRRED